MMETTAMTDRFDGADYNLRLLIERMQRMRGSEREIELAVRDASGCPSHPASSRWTALSRLWKREEG
jgi:hypothetical protein